MLTFLIYNVFVFKNTIWINSLVDFAPQNIEAYCSLTAI